MASIAGSGRIKLYAASRAVKQFAVEQRFKARYLTANRPFRQGEFLCGPGKIAVSCGGIKRLQGCATGYFSTHKRDSFSQLITPFSELMSLINEILSIYRA
jgi:hypothetical protein